jgi:hypothetical protein
MIEWIYSTGFPKSKNLGNGWGTALKPAHEPIVVARKPLIGTVAANVLAHSTGGINVAACRVEGNPRLTGTKNPDASKGSGASLTGSDGRKQMAYDANPPVGRWPSNFIHDGSAEVLAGFPNSNGGAYPAQRGKGQATGFGEGQPTPGGARQMGGAGSAARFFYCAKASKRDRDEGLNGVTLELEVCPCGDNTEQVMLLERAISEFATGAAGPQWNTGSSGNEKTGPCHRVVLSTTSTETSKTTALRTWSVWTSQPTNDFIAGVIETLAGAGLNLAGSAASISQLLITTSDQAVSARGVKSVVSETPLKTSASVEPLRNGHCTVKPTALMRYLCRLITPPGGLVLDPFAGSGSTGKAVLIEGFRFIGIEQDSDYCDIARRRIAHAASDREGRLF